MRNPLVPIQLALRAGPWLLLGLTLLERDEPDERVALPLGFQLATDEVDQVDPHLDPMEDD